MKYMAIFSITLLTFFSIQSGDKKIENAQRTKHISKTPRNGKKPFRLSRSESKAMKPRPTKEKHPIIKATNLHGLVLTAALLQLIR